MWFTIEMGTGTWEYHNFLVADLFASCQRNERVQWLVRRKRRIHQHNFLRRRCCSECFNNNNSRRDYEEKCIGYLSNIGDRVRRPPPSHKLSWTATQAPLSIRRTESFIFSLLYGWRSDLRTDGE